MSKPDPNEALRRALGIPELLEKKDELEMALASGDPNDPNYTGEYIVETALEIVDRHMRDDPEVQQWIVDNDQEFHVYCVWFCKTLQHWKALVSSNIPDGKYYELTHDGDKKVTYVDSYKKFKNAVVHHR